MNRMLSTQNTAVPLLRTKLYPAEGSGRPMLARTELLEHLFDKRQQRLMILSAPAGFGKSTVLSQFRLRLIEAGAKVAWLSCDEADSEPRRLLRYLVAGIEAQLPGLCSGTLRLLGEDLSLPNEVLLDAFIADLKKCHDPLYLLLDDVHRVRQLKLDELVIRFLQNAPDNIYVVGTTRYRTVMANPGSLNTRQVVWIEADDLRLSRSETEAYFHQLKQIPLSDRELDLLYKRTEGWVTALHLFALALARNSERKTLLAGLSGTERNIADYLTEDVLRHLPAEQQLFLEQTSLLDEFNADLCNALTGRSDADQMLQELRKAQLFIIALDAQGSWYRYHHLFAEFLQSRVNRGSSPSHLLHAASRWCESHDMVDKAVKYALRARDYTFAADLLERHGATLIAANQVYGILTVLKEVPSEVIREHPVFQIFYAWHLAFEHKYAEAEALIEEISNRLIQSRGKTLNFGLMLLLAVAQVLKALVLLYQDKLEGALKVARHWLSMVPDSQPIFRASLACIQAAAYALLGEFGQAEKSIHLARNSLRNGDSEYLNVVVSLIESLVCKEMGHPEQGRVLAEAARLRVEQVFGRHSRVGGPLALAYADLLYEQDRHAAILAELPQATTWRDVATPIELISRGKLVLAKARFFAGEGVSALAELDDWLESLHGPGYERVYALGMSCKVQFLLWLRKPNEAERTCLQLQRHLASFAEGRYADAETMLAITEARLALSERRAEKAQAALEANLSKQLAEHRKDRRLRLSLLLSVALWRKGNSDKAFALFGQIIEQAWSAGYRRLFLDDALWILPLLEAWREAEPKIAGKWQGLAEQLREQCLRLSIDLKMFDENQDVSHREREILRFVAAGLSNRDIAQAVHLSEATIKWHLHNLFSKLGVRSRTQAVLKGKALGLLSES